MVKGRGDAPSRRGRPARVHSTARAPEPQRARPSIASFGDWAQSLRFSGFTLLIVGLVIVGALIVSPTLSTYVQQQRQLSELRASVKLHREAVDEVEAARLKWQDPAYVRAQARGRLFYVMPGETQVSVIQDVVIPEDSTEETSDELTRIEQNWVQALVVSTLTAGTTTAGPDELRKQILGLPDDSGGPVAITEEEGAQ